MMHDQSFNVHTSLVFNPETCKWDSNVTISISPLTGLIESVYKRPFASIPALSPSDIDLRHLVVLPGLVDAHSHLFLHAESETTLGDQMVHESHVERIIRATTHARRALLAGFTTYRDLGTEGLGDSDIALRNSINRGLIPGPRCFVATSPIAPSSGYIMHSENVAIKLPKLADEADGIWAVRAAVRRRLAAGADIIKVYADEEKRTLRFPEGSWQGAAPVLFPPRDEKPRNYLLYTLDELKAIVEEAHRAECPVAVHAISAAAVSMAAEARADTIEHGSMADDASLEVIKKHNAMLVPTLGVMEIYVPAEPFRNEVMSITRKAWNLGIELAVGPDSGPAPHGQNAREIELMVDAGVPLEVVLKAATIGGWKACGGEWCGRRFGWWETGVAADIIGLNGKPKDDIACMRKVDFVMKDGKVWKRNGHAVDML